MSLFNPTEAAGVQATLLDTLIDVYVNDSATPAITGVRAHFAPLPLRGIAAGDRAALAARRELYVEPSYALSEYAQVADSHGVRWNVDAGTLLTLETGGVALYTRCDVVRVTEPS